MEWIVENWFWILLGLAFIAMHLFGHGGHGSHSGHGGHDSHGGQEDNRNEKEPQKRSDVGSGHQHHNS